MSSIFFNNPTHRRGIKNNTFVLKQKTPEIFTSLGFLGFADLKVYFNLPPKTPSNLFAPEMGALCHRELVSVV